VARRRGPQKAAVAVAKEMLVIIWPMLSNGEPYRGRDDGLVARKLKRMARIGGGLPQTPSKGMEGI
jgi:hypothetical protein